nr:hypothetical protein CFP56_00721 [Quercus suber]
MGVHGPCWCEHKDACGLFIGAAPEYQNGLADERFLNYLYTLRREATGNRQKARGLWPLAYCLHLTTCNGPWNALSSFPISSHYTYLTRHLLFSMAGPA